MKGSTVEIDTLSPEYLFPLIGSFVAVALFLAEVGRRVSVLLFPRGLPPRARGLTGWRWLFRRTLPAHPMIGGAVIGLLPIPAPEFMGGEIWGRVIWFSLAGALSLPIHGRIMRRIGGVAAG